MKKVFIKAAVVMFLFGTMCGCKDTMPVQAAQTDSKYMQDVPVDEAHFPDKNFRKNVEHLLDTNKDGILSKAERENVYYAEIGGVGYKNTWYTDMKFAGYSYEYSPGKSVTEDEIEVNSTSKKTFSFSLKDFSTGRPVEVMDITGIEYLFNLEEILITDYSIQKGSLKNNANLKKVWVKSSRYGAVSYEKIQQEIPLAQLSYLHMINIKIPSKGLIVSDMPKLEVLRIILPNGTNQTMKAWDLSKNKALKDLELANITSATLDLRKNTKLTSVKVYTGKTKREKISGYYYYQPKKKVSCKIQFPKKNNISTLYYFVDNTSLDARNLTKLEDLHTLKTTRIKVRSSWVRKTFNKKNWACIFVKNGMYQKKVKASKKKVTIL
ncbi:MAG: hypothetical protein ACI4SQ_03690 [Eubacterium sp.]